jgi:hypothetical protein
MSDDDRPAAGGRTKPAGRLNVSKRASANFDSDDSDDEEKARLKKVWPRFIS